MKKFRITLIITLCFIFAMSLIGLVACKEKTPEPVKPTVGKIQGTVLDVNGTPLEDVEIYYTDEDYVESNEKGKFEIKPVLIADISLTASFKGYNEATKNITKAEFNNEGVAKIQIVMEEGLGTIKGVVYVEENFDERIAGARVYIGSGSKYSTTTNEDGEYVLTDIPMLDRKVLTVDFEGYETVFRNITKRQYSKGVANVNFELTELELEELPGLKPCDLEREPVDPSKTTIKSDEIKNYFGISRENLQGSSKTETHSEGFCLNADTVEIRDNMVAYIYTKVTVDATHRYLTAYARMFAGQNNEGNNGGRLARLGLYAFDESGKFINDNSFGNFTEITTESYMPVTFDLSKYSGKTLTIVLGTNTGYHCCMDRLVFSAQKPSELPIKGVNGLTSLALYDKVTDTSFDVAALKDKWHVGGATGIVSEGIQLNGTGPWKAEDLNSSNPQPVNSYMYLTTDITEQASTFRLSSTIVKLQDIQDSAQGNKSFYPYISIILIDKNGNKLTQTEWTKIEVNSDKQPFELEYDFSQFVGKDITVIIAANVGYRATVTHVEFTAPSHKERVTE